MPQLWNGLAPEERGDILRVRPQGALCIEEDWLRDRQRIVSLYSNSRSVVNETVDDQ